MFAKISLIKLLSIYLFAAVSNHSCTSKSPLVWNYEVLEKNKELLETDNTSIKSALSALLIDANQLLAKRPFSVTEKQKTPPSGDKRDYMSIAPYWWPDPFKPDGLPYINKDGETNPEVTSIKDKTYLRELCHDIPVLGLAYFYTGEEKYAEKASDFLRTWFINDETRMNPNLKYAQAIPGRFDGRSTGLIDTRPIIELLDGVSLLAGSASWTSGDQKALTDWVNSYLDWLLSSELGKQAAEATNNVGTSYDTQIIAYSLFVGKKHTATSVLRNRIPQRLEHQFEIDGSQPEEMKRTNSWEYSVANLNHWFTLGRLAEHAGFDLWNFETASGKSVEKGLRFLEPYAKGEKKWERNQVRSVNFVRSYQFLERRRESLREGARRSTRGARGQLEETASSVTPDNTTVTYIDILTLKQD